MSTMPISRITTNSGVAIFTPFCTVKKLLAVVGRRDLACAGVIHLQRRIRLEVGLLPGGQPHLDAGEDQERAEHVQDPVELRDQPGADQDHDGAQHERAEDAEHQHALLVLRRHREVREHQQEHEDVVDRQRLLDQVAGDELERLGVGDWRCRRARRGTTRASRRTRTRPRPRSATRWPLPSS